MVSESSDRSSLVLVLVVQYSVAAAAAADKLINTKKFKQTGVTATLIRSKRSSCSVYQISKVFFNNNQRKCKLRFI